MKKGTGRARLVLLVIVAAVYGKMWFQAFMSRADVSMLSLIGMGFRQVKPTVIITAKVMAAQAGLSINRRTGISTSRLEAHYLAGGNVMNVMRAIIAAHRAEHRLWISTARRRSIWPDATSWTLFGPASIRKSSIAPIRNAAARTR
jgi:uncharacterized protein YqfA (UPF0365 family)